jgi:hypothetical protein
MSALRWYCTEHGFVIGSADSPYCPHCPGSPGDPGYQGYLTPMNPAYPGAYPDPQNRIADDAAREAKYAALLQTIMDAPNPVKVLDGLRRIAGDAQTFDRVLMVPDGLTQIEIRVRFQAMDFSENQCRVLSMLADLFAEFERRFPKPQSANEQIPQPTNDGSEERQQQNQSKSADPGNFKV